MLAQGQGSARLSAVTVVLPSTLLPPSALAFRASMASHDSQNQVKGPNGPVWPTSMRAWLVSRVSRRETLVTPEH